MTYGDPELELDPPCPACGSLAVFTAVAPRPASAKCPSIPLAATAVASARDLADYYGDPPA